MAAVNKKGAAGAVCSVAAVITIVLSHGHIRTNQHGLELIGNAEACRRDPYVCPAGKLTNGIGNTHNVIPGVRLTDDEIARSWEKNILESESCVNTYGRGKKLPDGAFSAAVSIAFNTGCPAMQRSALFRYLRNGEVIMACNEFPRWVYAGGRKLPGLVARREKERALCLSDKK